MKVELIDYMGSDRAVCDAARVSFSKTAEHYSDEQNDKLLDYLARHDHWTPFAHTAIKLRLSAPVSIRTQCFKHKAGFVENEESRRYISTLPEYFLPTFRNKPMNGAKQGSSGELSETNQKHWQQEYTKHVCQAIALYDRMIKEGIAPEQARFVLPQGVEVEWIWTGNLSSFARFYLQRTDSHAQKEIQELAHMVGDIIKPLFPVSWQALTRKTKVA